MIAELSADQKLLLAAVELQQAKSTFTAEELVVTAWTMFPETFGLQGFESKHPDSNRVLWRIMGKKGLRTSGWLQKVREKTYRLTEAGKITGAGLNKVGGRPAERAADFPRVYKEMLTRLLASRALAKVRDGMDALVFRDAEEFWNISTRTNAATLTNRLADVEAVLAATERALKETGENLSLQRGTLSVTWSDLAEIRRTHEALLTRFKEDLDYIRTVRTDERKR
jgi:hypothetical protein